MTFEPMGAGWSRSFRLHAKEIEAAGLPIQPYLGSTSLEIAAFLVKTLRRALEATEILNPKGKGWAVKLRNEYDWQNLFFLVLKPWLPGLGREEVTITYDGQEKSADFNLFGSQLIVEMKNIRDANTKGAVSKTLIGLGSFYKQHPNVRVILFAILLDRDVNLDDAKWESDFTFTERAPQVWTRIFRAP